MTFAILIIDANRISMRFHKEKKGDPVREVDSMEIKLDFFMGGETDQASFQRCCVFSRVSPLQKLIGKITLGNNSIIVDGKRKSLSRFGLP